MKVKMVDNNIKNKVIRGDLNRGIKSGTFLLPGEDSSDKIS